MSDESAIQELPENWKPKVLLIGTVLGAVVGLGAAYLLVQRTEREGGGFDMTAREGVKLGVLIFGLLRSVSQLGGKD
jgi:hypothetical protein